MTGMVKQEEIEMVFEDLMSSEIENMSEEDRAASMGFFLREASRFAAPEHKEDEEHECECEGEWCECEEDEEEEPRHYSDPDADGLRECIDDLKEENAELTEMNSLRREMNTLMVVRNTLTEEEKCLKKEMLDAEDKWGRLLRKESPKTDNTKDIKDIKDIEIERLWSEVQKLEREAEVRKVTWWRRWFLWWL